MLMKGLSTESTISIFVCSAYHGSSGSAARWVDARRITITPQPMSLIGWCGNPAEISRMNQVLGQVIQEEQRHQKPPLSWRENHDMWLDGAKRVRYGNYLAELREHLCRLRTLLYTQFNLLKI